MVHPVGRNARLRESPHSRTRLAFDLGGRAVVLSDEAQAAVRDDPASADLTASDFSSATFGIGLEHDRVLGPGALSAELGAGRSWYGGDPSYDFARLSLSYTLPVTDADAIRLGSWVEGRDRAGGAADERVQGATLAWSHDWPDLGTSVVSLAFSGVTSDNGNRASTTRGLQLSHSFADPVGPARIGLSATWQTTTFPDYAVILPVPGGRQDDRAALGLTARFTDWSWAGFVPVLQLEAERTKSNVSRFETRSMQLGLEVRSTF